MPELVDHPEQSTCPKCGGERKRTELAGVRDGAYVLDCECGRREVYELPPMKVTIVL